VIVDPEISCKRTGDPVAKHCALYLRVSTEHQLDGNSLATQKAQLLRHAKDKGYVVADIYMDAGLSGKDMNRPELQRLLADAARRRFDIVLVWKVDRISRSMKDFLGLIATLREQGVELAALDQQFDTSDPVGTLTLHMLGGFAQFEREMLVERTKEGHLHRLRRQDWSCGPVPLGYRKVDGRLVEVPEEAMVVRRVFDLFLKLKGRRAVAMRLNANGLRTRRGALWTSNTVTEALRNPVYMGANVYGRHRKGDTRLKDGDDWTVLPGMRVAMVATETFEAAQALLAEAQDGLVEKAQPATYSLKGLVRCGKCGGAMCGTAKRKENGKVYRYYRCNGNAHQGGGRCPGAMVPADLLEKAVAEKVHELAPNSPTARPGMHDAATTESEERREARCALDRFRERTARLFDLYEMGHVDKALFQERMAGLSEERGRLTANLKAAAKRDGAHDTPAAGATAGVVKVVVQDRRAKVYMANGAVSEGSITMAIYQHLDLVDTAGAVSRLPVVNTARSDSEVRHTGTGAVASFLDAFGQMPEPLIP
jgi:site-specific DNA recombinase